jgi:four helix bundle protein
MRSRPTPPQPEPGDEAPDIERRTYRFALRVLHLVRAIPKDVGSQVIAKQLARCGTAIGSNVAEAQGAHSRKDFARRLNNARSEARETLYWLNLLHESGVFPRRRLEAIVDEPEQIFRTLVAIVKRPKLE